METAEGLVHERESMVGTSEEEGVVVTADGFVESSEAGRSEFFIVPGFESWLRCKLALGADAQEIRESIQ